MEANDFGRFFKTQANAAFWRIFANYVDAFGESIYYMIIENAHARTIPHHSPSYWTAIEAIAQEFTENHMRSWAPPQGIKHIHSIICIDEAREFVRYEPNCLIDTLSHMNRAARLLPLGSIFVFMDTLGDINILDPAYVYPSARARTQGILQAAYTDLVYWDLIATTEGVKGIRTIFDTLPEKAMIRFGRPLWGAASRAGYTDILTLARLKLAQAQHIIQGGLHRLAQLAILASRIDIQVNPFHQEARELTGSYMAYVKSFDSSTRALVVSYPSDPLLSAAARSLLVKNSATNLWGTCILQLSESLNNRLTLSGDRGELVGQILCCHAADIVMGARARSDRSLRVNEFLEALIGAEALEAACSKESLDAQAAQRLLAGHVNFNHFIRVEGYTPNRQDLVKFLQRRAAVICKKGQWGADLIIPVVLEKPWREASGADPKATRVPLPKRFEPFHKHRLELCGEPTCLMTDYAKEIGAALGGIWGSDKTDGEERDMNLDAPAAKRRPRGDPHGGSVVAKPEEIESDTYLLEARSISYIIINCNNYQSEGSRLPNKIKHLNPFGCGIETLMSGPPPPYFALGLFFDSKIERGYAHSDLMTYEASEFKDWVDQYGLTRSATNAHVLYDMIKASLDTLLREIPQVGGNELEKIQGLLRLILQSPLVYGTVLDYETEGDIKG